MFWKVVSSSLTTCINPLFTVLFEFFLLLHPLTLQYELQALHNPYSDLMSMAVLQVGHFVTNNVLANILEGIK
jgi:hypothetical protein